MTQDEFRPKAEEIEGQKLPYPAKQSDMKQQPDSDLSNYKGAEKLKDKVASDSMENNMVLMMIGSLIGHLGLVCLLVY